MLDFDYDLCVYLPRSLAPKGLERTLCRWVAELMEESLPGSEVNAMLIEAGPAAVTLADGSMPPLAAREAFAEAVEDWQKVAPTDRPEWDASEIARILDHLPRPPRPRGASSGANGSKP